MANIGDVTARLRADVGPYITGMQEAGLANRDFAATGTQTTSRAEQISLAFQRLERREPTMAVRQLRGALGLLAAEAIGTTGPLGRMAESLAFLMGGSAVTLGVLAGIAAIGFALQRLQSVSIDTSIKITDLRKTIQQLGDATPEAKFRNTQAIIRDVNRQITEQRDKLKDAEGRWRGLVVLLGEHNTRTQAAAHDVEVLKDKLAELSGVLFNLREQGIAKMPAIDVKVDEDLIRRRMQSAVQAAVMHANEAERQRRMQNNWLTQLRGRVPEPMETSEEFTARVRKELGDLAGQADDQLSHRMEQAGYHAMRSLIDGILRGKADFQDIFIGLLSEFLSAGLGSLFGNLFKSVAGVGGGGGVASVAGAPSNLVVNVPPASNPIVFARDAQWQKALRESINVARQSGYKVA